MKDEWDLFAAVHRSLMDGQQLVTVRQYIYSLERPEDGNYGMATDEAGELVLATVAMRRLGG